MYRSQRGGLKGVALPRWPYPGALGFLAIAPMLDSTAVEELEPRRIKFLFRPAKFVCTNENGATSYAVAQKPLLRVEPGTCVLH